MVGSLSTGCLWVSMVEEVDVAIALQQEIEVGDLVMLQRDRASGK